MIGGTTEVNGVTLQKHKGVEVTAVDRALLFIFANLIEGEFALVLKRKKDIMKNMEFELNLEVHKIELGETFGMKPSEGFA